MLCTLRSLDQYKMFLIEIYSLLFLIQLGGVYSEDEKTLFKDLFEDYVTSARPVKNVSFSLTVTEQIKS